MGAISFIDFRENKTKTCFTNLSNFSKNIKVYFLIFQMFEVEIDAASAIQICRQLTAVGLGQQKQFALSLLRYIGDAVELLSKQ